MLEPQAVFVVAVLIAALSAVLAHFGYRSPSYVVGIDLGTSFSVAAIKPADAEKSVSPTVVNHYSTNSPLVPSIVSYFPNGTAAVGDAAVTRQELFLEDTIYHAKRFIGKGIEEVSSDSDAHPFKVVPSPNSTDEVLFSVLNGTLSVSPVDVGVQVVKELLKSVEAIVGSSGASKKVVICVPVEFNQLQRDATRRVYEELGLTVTRLIDEPVAAAVAYNLHQRSGGASSRVVVVFDLGGGTLDVSVLQVATFSGSINVLSTSGDQQLGGQDFDRVLAKLINQKCKRQNPDHPEHYSNVMAERVKRELTVRENTTVCGGQLITRDEFAEAASELLDRIYDTMHRSMRLVMLDPEYVSDVVFAGGASRMPIVQDTVYAAFEDADPRFHTELDPDLLVALGAANIVD
ncbi:Heat shock 70 kDa protein, putative [Perkinsus marinus ATCC 50983]|uniref:Heat shock 70 kDa protein, putative n=1 Tax=Perkinsus marinus (strain ATCC 50983 / TXsc) TaxID=423536 RepID=C5LEU3_PERM5|nr:Heat shock 70 kDa protein, putative [Perkinsus marinus ATCC 50983]EER04709.1 Heat shock 70 kDa protein, putative [Perkinsus marinus ATCC 50983]|eukprot:XP_002772893.1 Heat shock 70 kDa protein, putative [Perkinsus marinus ATCC 50983]